ncbi:MAG: hypothetical protein HC892_06520 [Saprospiraceae bacterium]|nr:hypothetical protein [Saprospiraceae bacterium]
MRQNLILISLLCSLLNGLSLYGQESENYQLWRAAVERRIQDGTFREFHGDDALFEGIDVLEKNGSVCPEVDAGYGTAGWGPASNSIGKNADPSCTIKNNLRSCNGGKYRIAMRNVILNVLTGMEITI